MRAPNGSPSPSPRWTTNFDAPCFRICSATGISRKLPPPQRSQVCLILAEMDEDEAVVIRLIGDVRVVHSGQVVDPRAVGGARCVDVLAYLAVNRNRDVAQDELAGILWPKDRPPSWNAALRGVLSRVRDTMGLASLPVGCVRSRGGSVRLSLPDGLVTDIEVLRRSCAGPAGAWRSSVAVARNANPMDYGEHPAGPLAGDPHALSHFRIRHGGGLAARAGWCCMLARPSNSSEELPCPNRLMWVRSSMAPSRI